MDRLRTIDYVRVVPIVVAVVVVLGGLGVVYDFQSALAAWYGQLTLPYSINLWSDGPLIVQIVRILRGYLPYTPVYGVDSFTYGPAYLYLLALLYRPFGSVASIVPLRFISTAIGALACIPVALALTAFRKARPGAASRYAAVLATVFTLVIYLMIQGRDRTFSALHPDPLVFLSVAISIACFLWYPLVERKNLVLGILLASTFIEALAKLNGAPQIAFFLAALVLVRAMSWRRALLVLVGFAAVLALYFVLIPSAERSWTLTIPAHHWFRSPWDGAIWVLSDWFVIEPWQSVLVLGTLGALISDFVAGRRREAAAYGLIIAGLFATGFFALLKIGGGPYDISWIYIACAIRCGAFVEATLRQAGKLGRDSLAASGGVALFAILLPITFMHGWHVEAALSRGARADLARTSKALAALCRPHYHIMVTWFPDPLLRCPGATFQMWDSVEEVTWGRGQGYYIPTIMDRPISPDAFVMLRESWYTDTMPSWVFPIHLVGDYRVQTYLVYDTVPWFWSVRHIDVFMKAASYPNGNANAEGLLLLR